MLFQKRDNKNIENHQSILYKLLTKVITNHLTNKLDFYESVKQAEHTPHTIRTIIYKWTVYYVPLPVTCRFPMNTKVNNKTKINKK